MQSGLAPQPGVAVENWDISAAELPLRSQGSQSHTVLTSSEHRFREEELPQHLAVKISRDSFHAGETEGCWKPRCPLKGCPQDTITLVHLPWAPVKGEQLRGCQRHTGRNTLWLQGEGWRDDGYHCPSSSHPATRQAPSFLSSSPAQQNLNLHWPGTGHCLPTRGYDLCKPLCTQHTSTMVSSQNTWVYQTLGYTRKN